MSSFGRVVDDLAVTHVNAHATLPRWRRATGAYAHDGAIVVATVALVGASACRLGGGDTVGVGYYGAVQAGSGGARNTTPNQASGGSHSQGNGTPLAGGMITKPPTTASPEPSGPTGASGSSNPSAAGSPSSTAGSTPGIGAAGVGAAGAGAAGIAAAGATGATGTDAPGPCDLSGRWLSTVHYVTEALGQQQVTHSILYYEIAQQGDSFTISKGMQCSDDTVGLGSFAATVDTRASWAAVASKAGYTGRTGSSTAVNGSCQIEFQKWYAVRGATVPYYTDPANALPTVDQKATDTAPGWEDWDGDGNPGITGVVSGAVTGKVFIAPRLWTTISASVPDVSSLFKVPLQWNVEQNVMSFDGTPLLAGEAVRATDMSLHFVELARLAPDQATGDDQAICASLIALAPTLTPTAAGM